MATIEQQLAARLKKEGVLRLPIDLTGTMFAATTARRNARERARRIVSWTNREASITIDPDESQIIVTLKDRT